MQNSRQLELHPTASREFSTVHSEFCILNSAFCMTRLHLFTISLTTAQTRSGVSPFMQR